MRLRSLIIVLGLLQCSPTKAQYSSVKEEAWSSLQYNSQASIPPELSARIKKHGLDQTFAPVYEVVNPFYLCGDFDGDAIRDYAVLLRLKDQTQDRSPRIAILRGSGQLHWLAADLKEKGAYPGPAWWIFDRREKVRNRTDLNHQIAPKLVGDGFIIARPESSSALIYWDGKKFNLYWQSD